MKKGFMGTAVLSLLAFVLNLAPQAQAKSLLDLDKSPGKVEFKAVGKPSFMKINGKNGKATGKISVDGRKVEGMLSVVLDEMTTGMDLRDEHMKEKYLETKKHPKAFLKITKMTLPKPIEGKKVSFEKVPFEAMFKLHGVTKKIKGEADIESTGDQVEAEVRLSLKIPDYKMGIPSFKGITVAEKVDVIVKIASAMQK